MASNEGPQTSEPIPNLRQRMALAMGDIGRVAKAGKLVSGQTKYDYTKADDIITEVRAALIQHGIVFLSSESGTKRLPDREAHSGSAILSVEVTMEFTLLDTTSDEKLTAHHTGEGMDSGDKAINKAKTAALKYFLQQTFLIPTGDDPEKDDHELKTKKQDDNARTTRAGNYTKAGSNIHQGTDGIIATEEQRKQLLATAKRLMGDEQGRKWVTQRRADLGITTAEQFQLHYHTMLTKELQELAQGEHVEPLEPPPKIEEDLQW